MSRRFHVAAPAQAALVQIALDQALGLRDVVGNATPKEQMVTFDGGLTFAPASKTVLGPLHNCYDRPDTKSRLILGADGTAALEIDDEPAVLAVLGRGSLPTAASLVQVVRPRDASALPAGVRDVVDDGFVDGVFQNPALTRTEKEAAVTLELQNGTRAANALARKTTREGQQAIEAALGLGGR